MSKLLFYVTGQRPQGPAAAEHDERAAPWRGRNREPLITRVTWRSVPVPQGCVREWVGEPTGLSQAALAVRDLASGPTPLRPLLRAKHNVGCYVAGDLFIKVGLGAQALRIGREGIHARWAGEHGWAPPVTQTPGRPGVLVSQYLATPPPTPTELKDPKFWGDAVTTLRGLHGASPLFRRNDALDPIALENFALLRRNKLAHRHAPLCDLSQLKARAEHLVLKLKMRRAEEMFCHFATTPEHTRWVDGQVVFLSWAQARFSDPLRDVAMLFALADVAATSAHTVLCQYYAGPPSRLASERFALWAMALALDEHCRLVRASRTQREDLRQSHRRIVALEMLCPALPPIAWQLPASLVAPLRGARR